MPSKLMSTLRAPALASSQALGGADPRSTEDAFGALAESLLAGLERLAQGFAILDSEGQLRYVNSAARVALNRMNWVAPAARAGQEAKQKFEPWAHALRRVCEQGLRELVEVPHGEGMDYAALLPIEVRGEVLGFVTFGRDEICGPVELQMFAHRAGLTAAESAVLRQLCRGLRASQIARANGVSAATVLSQITAIRDKTLFRSIRELLSTLSRMPTLTTTIHAATLD